MIATRRRRRRHSSGRTVESSRSPAAICCSSSAAALCQSSHLTPRTFSSSARSADSADTSGSSVDSVVEDAEAQTRAADLRGEYVGSDLQRGQCRCLPPRRSLRGRSIATSPTMPPTAPYRIRLGIRACARREHCRQQREPYGVEVDDRLVQRRVAHPQCTEVCQWITETGELHVHQSLDPALVVKELPGVEVNPGRLRTS